MAPDLISIVVPAHNSETFIGESLESILAQTYQNLEIIVVDDGSTDNTENIVRSYSDTRIKYVAQENSGSAAARNLGIKSATGSWIAFLDSDDIWFPQKLENQLSRYSSYQWSHTDAFFLGGVYKPNTRVSDLTEKQSGNVLKGLLQENFIGTSCVMARKEVLEEVGGFKTSLRALQDWDLWLRLAAKYPLGYCDEPLTYYRVHSQSVSRSTRKTLPYHLELIENAYSPTGVAHQHRELKPLSLSNSYNICSQISEQENDLTFSLYCAFYSLYYKPNDLSGYKRLIKQVIKTLIFLPLIKIRQNYRNRSPESDPDKSHGA